MRITLEVNNDLMQAAKDLARLSGKSIGQTLSELVRRGLARHTPVLEMHDGIPVWVQRPVELPVTSELVRNLAHEEEISLFMTFTQ